MNFWSNIARMAALGLALSGCATVDYLHTPAGQFKGTAFVMWAGEGNGSGDGNFLFVPDPRDPLIFTRADPQSLGGVIQPGLMYTDGGSIPKIAQVFNGFSPWGYAPGYMIHDWLFVGRHCLVDGELGWVPVGTTIGEILTEYVSGMSSAPALSPISESLTATQRQEFQFLRLGLRVIGYGRALSDRR
jgi:hypothetical protein